MRTNGIVLTTQLCVWTIQKSVNGEWRDAILHQQRVSALVQPRSLGTWLLTGGGSTGKRHYPGVDFDRTVNDENHCKSVIERFTRWLVSRLGQSESPVQYVWILTDKDTLSISRTLINFFQRCPLIHH